MRTTRLILIAAMLTASLCAVARERRFMSRIDSLLAVRLERMQAKVDTDYIQLPDQIWTFRSLANIGRSSVDAGGHYGDSITYESTFNTDVRTSMTLTANYRGFTVGFTLNPAKLSGRNKDMELYILGYGNRIGVEALIQSANTYSGTVKVMNALGTELGQVEVGKGWIAQRGVNVNAYYAFNYKRFSYPAAFTHSYLQVRPAGSLMVNASYQLTEMNRKGMFYDGDNLMDRITTNMVGIGVGYAYHFVPTSHWLIHISCLPSIVVYEHNSIHFPDGMSLRMRYNFPEAIIFAQHSVIYSWNRYFSGMNTSFHFSNIGRQQSMYYNNQTWRVRLLFGVRI